MGCQKTIYVAKELYDYWTTAMTSMGFESFSELLNYTQRFACDIIGRNGLKSVPSIDRTDRVKVCVRVNPYVDDMIKGMNFCKKTEVYDLALLIYRNYTIEG